jgi:hypothetical protein
MQKQIFAALAVVIGLALAGAYYLHRAKIRAMNNGTVYVRNQNGGTATLTTPAPDASSTPASDAGSEPATASSPAESQANPPVLATPIVDTLPRNPPNGLAYKGTGKFLLYRQGDITWRLDTDTGFACVLLATNAQWSRLRVYQHGCGTS